MRIKNIAAGIIILGSSLAAQADTIPSGFSREPEWRAGINLSGAWVPGTNTFLKGSNLENKRIGATLSGDIRADFSFNPSTREGILYKDTYQGIGVGANTFFAPRLLGNPVSAYIYQGAPIVHFNDRLWLGYEWQFGAAFGWKYYHKESADNNAVVSTPVTAHMGIGFNLNYRLSEQWQLSFGISGNHYSNGNTSLPNAGVNSLGATVGFAYTINPQKASLPANTAAIEEEADRSRWLFDIMAFGAWRKRVVSIYTPPEPQLCPGKFGIAGFQFSPLRQFNRWFAAGPAIDFQWDESAGLDEYWVEGTSGDYIRFERPPFGKQISLGLSAHAELIMPIFTVNAGIGYDIINPKGDKAFYQSLTLKTFITKRVFLNVGYRLGSFKDPQNLMLGVGIRL